MRICASNIFTVDLEDTVFAQPSTKRLPDGFTSRAIDNLVQNTRAILDLLSSSGSSATFFTLGRLAEEIPELVKEISESGSEIACHGYYHSHLEMLGPERFAIELERASCAIEGATGAAPVGFRAPYFSMNQNTSWAFDVLKRMGFVYDSSVQPFGLHPGYGMPEAACRVHRRANGLAEIPMSVASFHSIRIPCSGGAYFRAYPTQLFNYLFNTSCRQNGYGIFYIHPWEMKETPSPSRESFLARQRRQFNTSKTREKIQKLLSKYSFVSASDYLKHHLLDENDR